MTDEGEEETEEQRRQHRRAEILRGAEAFERSEVASWVRNARPVEGTPEELHARAAALHGAARADAGRRLAHLLLAREVHAMALERCERLTRELAAAHEDLREWSAIVEGLANGAHDAFRSLAPKRRVMFHGWSEEPIVLFDDVSRATTENDE